MGPVDSSHAVGLPFGSTAPTSSRGFDDGSPQDVVVQRSWPSLPCSPAVLLPPPPICPRRLHRCIIQALFSIQKESC